MSKRFKDAEKFSKGSAVRHKEQVREMENGVVDEMSNPEKQSAPSTEQGSIEKFYGEWSKVDGRTAAKMEDWPFRLAEAYAASRTRDLQAEVERLRQELKTAKEFTERWTKLCEYGSGVFEAQYAEIEKLKLESDDLQRRLDAAMQLLAECERLMNVSDPDAYRRFADKLRAAIAPAQPAPKP